MLILCYKILSKAITMGLLQLYTYLVHPDQCNFTPSHNKLMNIRRLCHIMDNIQWVASHTILMSVDLEKEFYKLIWHYLQS